MQSCDWYCSSLHVLAVTILGSGVQQELWSREGAEGAESSERTVGREQAQGQK